VTTTSHDVVHLDVVESLVVRVSGEFDVEPELVRRHALLVLEQYADSRVQSFIPLLVERRVRDWLREMRRLSALAPEQLSSS
jgi:hypothetical protein